MNQENTREKVELLPCPLCAGAMRVRTTRDWHHLVGDHSDDCLMHDFEPYGPATPDELESLVAAWNRRASPSSPSQEEVLVRARGCLRFIVERENFAFAECSEAEEIWSRARSALSEVERALQGQEGK